jgi:tetratricopeptide (TPR) repeat protein
MKQYAYLCLIMLSVSYLASCQSSDDATSRSQLDVGFQKTPEFKRTTDHGGWTTDQWHQFFQRPPTDAERHILAKKTIPVDDADSLSDLKQLGQRHLSLGNLAEAEAAFEAAVRKAPHDAIAVLSLAELALRNGKSDASFDHLHHVLKIIKDRSETKGEVLFRYKYVLASAHLQSADFEAAKKIFTDLVGIEKTFTPAYVGLASMYLTLAKPEMALFIAQRALDRATPTASLYNTLGLVHRQLGDTTKAKKYFYDALALESGHVSTQINLAATLFSQGERDAAENILRRVAKSAPSDLSTHLALGVCQRQMGQKNAARVSLQRVLDINPENARARLELAQLMNEDFKDREASIQLLREVISINEPRSRELAQLYLDDLLSRGD